MRRSEGLSDHLALLAHLQATALDDVAGEFVLREVPQAEHTLGKLTAPRD